MAKKWKIIIDKHAFDYVSPEDRRKIMKEFIKAVQDGSLIRKSEQVDMKKLQKEDPVLYKRLKSLTGQ